MHKEMEKALVERILQDLEAGSDLPAKDGPWSGARRCDLCEEVIPMTEGTILYDAFCRTYRTWSTMCKDCFQLHGYGDAALGTGHGQKFEVVGGVLRKVAG